MEQSNEELQLRIRELEKEIAKLHTQIKKERYGLVWLDVPEGFERESENQIPVLEEVKDKAIKNDDGKPTHIIIEGDNYHALTCLNYTHKGKIDVIYIDPPYNTGSDGFTYKDKRFLKEFPDGSPVPKDHPLRHSYWLSFMSKRLELAKNLLSDKGVIFISIDDNEQANCKLLCDKIFGESNFVSCIVITSNSSKNNAICVSVNTEYLLVYANNLLYHNTKWLVKKNYVDDYNTTAKRLLQSGMSDDEIQNELRQLTRYPKFYDFDHYTYVDKKGPFQASDLTAPSSKNFYDIIHPITHKSCAKGRRGWAFSEEKMKVLLEEGRILFGENEDVMPRLKNYLCDNEYQLLKSSLFFDSQSSTKWMKDNGFDFPFPKSIEYIKYILSSFPQKSSIILDFFAGSGTTLHATMKLNAEDGGNRQCILVQQKEGDKNICESVTYERNKRVINGYTNAKGEQIPGLGNSLKYYRTAFVGKNPPRRATDYDKTELSKKAGCLLALAENTLEEIEASNSFQIFSDGKNHYTGVYFTGRLTEIETFTQKLEDIRNQNRRIKITAYFFCWGDCAQFEDEFTNLERISLQPIPKPILDIYQSINR